jgi:hypothetical protein
MSMGGQKSKLEDNNKKDLQEVGMGRMDGSIWLKKGQMKATCILRQ